MIKFQLSVLALVATSILVWQVHAQPRPPGPTAPSPPGEQPSRDFELQMCSQTARQDGDIYVATAAAVPSGLRKILDGSLIEVQGWRKIAVSQCVNIGSFARPGIFAFASTQNGQTLWSDSEPQLCVNLNASFEYQFNADAGRACAPAETQRGFFKISAKAKQPSSKVTFKPNAKFTLE
jgi:uncharacterized protein DUF1036